MQQWVGLTEEKGVTPSPGGPCDQSTTATSLSGAWKRVIHSSLVQGLQTATVVAPVLRRKHTQEQGRPCLTSKLRKAFLHVSVTHRLLPFEAKLSQLSSLSSGVTEARPLPTALFVQEFL